MAQLDASIILGGRGPQIANPLDMAEKGMSLRRLSQQNAAADKEAGRKQRFSDLLKENTTVDAAGKPQVNKRAALSGMYKEDPAAAMEFEDLVRKQDLEKLTYDTGLMKQAAFNAKPETYPAIRQQLIEQGVINADKLPPEWNDQFVQKWQVGTLSGEQQLEQMWKEKNFQQEDRKIAASRANTTASKEIAREEKRERQTDQDMQKLSKDVAGVQEMVGAVDEVEKVLGAPLESFEVKNGKLLKDKKSVDLPGFSLPGLGRISMHSQESRQLADTASRVFNATLKDRSGGAVTDNEMERLRKEFSEGKFNTEPELIDALQRYKRQTAIVLKNREAAYNPAVVGRYTDQGGRTSQTIQRGQQAPQIQTTQINGETYQKVDGGWQRVQTVGQE